MGLLNIPRIPRGADLEEAINIYNMAIEEMEHRINGFLQSSNIQEVGGWKVSQTELKAKDNDVGMSTEDTAGDDVRFWAGGADKNTAPWRVTKSGKMNATGAVIESSSGFPKFVIDPDGKFIAFYTDAENYIKILAEFTNGKPAIEFVAGDAAAGTMSAPERMVFEGLFGLDLKGGAGPVYLHTDGLDGIQFDSWGEIMSIGDGQSLADALNNLATAIAAKATAGSATSMDGLHNHGIPDGTEIMVNGGGFVTFSASGNHSHTQQA